jgi:hypothetical protein
MKKRTILILVVVILIIVIFELPSIYFKRTSSLSVKEMKYRGVISKIEYRPLRKGNPDIQLSGNQWIEFSYHEEEFQNELHAGDSISKEKGDDYLELYRKNSPQGVYLKVAVYKIK